MDWTNEDIFEFLSLYEDEQALWNTKIPEHKNKSDQHFAWNRIKREFRDGETPLKDIKKKKDHLMSTYRKLRSKVQASALTTSNPDDYYKPDWPFYNVMSKFLDDVYKPRKRKRKFQETKLKNETDDEDNQSENAQNHEDDQDTDESEGSCPIAQINPKIMKTLKPERIEEVYTEEPYKLKSLSLEHDECSMYTDLLRVKLRALQEKTRDIAMLEIDRLMFHLKQNEENIQASTYNFSLPTFNKL